MNLHKLLAFHQLVIDKNEDEKKELAKLHDIDYEEYKKRIKGKEKESDFIIVLKSLEVLKHFEAYDEGLSHITKEFTPDFKIEMYDGYKMLLEVKHTDKEKFEISLGNLQKRIDYAKREKLPLRFAVSLKGFWGLFTTETLQKKRGKLTISDFKGEKSSSWLDIELATCSYMFKKQVKIRSVYSKNHTKGMGIKFEPYGELISYELYYGKKRIFRAKGKESKYIPYTIYLEALHDRIANINQDIEKQGEFTIITEYADESISHIIPEYEFVLSPIQHLYKEVNSKRIRYDSHSALNEHGFKFLSVRMLRVILDDLVDLGLDIVVFRGNCGYAFKDYAEKFWTKN